MPRLCSWVSILGALLLCVCVVHATLPSYVLYEVPREGRICYSIGTTPPTTLTLSEAANEQSEISEGDGLHEEVTLSETFTWNLRENCTSGSITINGVSRGLPIRNQDTCGACWAYAHNDFVTLWHCQHNNTNDMTKMTQVSSLQQHVDCVPSKTEHGVRNAGCGTGSLKLASLYYMGKLTAQNIPGSGATQGFASEADYPMTYTPELDRVIVRDPDHNYGQCMYQPNVQFPWGQSERPTNAAELKIDVGPLSQSQMTWLFQQNRAPFATSMFVVDSLMMIVQCSETEATGTSVYNNPNQCPIGTPANHAVVAIGMGRTTHVSSIPYWLIRNSWGLAWGDQGHIRLIRDSTNTHVPGSDPMYPGGVAMCSLGYMNSYPRAEDAQVEDSCTTFSFA